MPFGTITSQTKNYEPRSPGVYSESTVSFGSPSNEYRISGASVGRDKLLRANIVRVLEKDYTVGGVTERRRLTVALSITSPSAAFTSAEIDSLAEDISVFLTASTVTRLMQGES